MMLQEENQQHKNRSVQEATSNESQPKKNYEKRWENILYVLNIHKTIIKIGRFERGVR